MTYITSWRTRLTKSARGEFFNPLIYPFLLTTFSYGLGFTLFRFTEAVNKSSLYSAMDSLNPLVPVVWGALALVTIVVGFYVLLFDKPPVGKVNATLAWLLWLFAALVYVITGGWLTLFAVAIPSLFFWTWQYFSLLKFRQQDVLDNASMRRYDDGEYDDDNGGKQLRLDNRGVDENDRTPY